MEPAALRDRWPAGSPGLRGAERRVYEAFVAAGRRAVLRAQVVPAAVAGCAVRQLVQQPLTWELRRPAERDATSTARR